VEKVPPPKETRPKAPEKPSLFGERGFVQTNFFRKELKKEEYFEKLGLPKEKREKIGEILSNKKIFGEIIEKSEIGKIRSLINELRNPRSSVDDGIREIARKVRQEVGEFKAKKLADILKERFGL